MQKRANGISGKLRAMKSCLGKAAEGYGNRFRRDRSGFRGCAAAELLGEERSAGDGGGATAAEETDFADAARFESGEKFEDVAADRIAHFDGCGGAGQFARVARIAEVIENGFAEHG